METLVSTLPLIILIKYSQYTILIKMTLLLTFKIPQESLLKMKTYHLLRMIKKKKKVKKRKQMRKMKMRKPSQSTMKMEN